MLSEAPHFSILKTASSSTGSLSLVGANSTSLLYGCPEDGFSIIDSILLSKDSTVVSLSSSATSTNSSPGVS